MSGMLCVTEDLRKQILRSQVALIEIAQAETLEEAKELANTAIQNLEEWRESMR